MTVLTVKNESELKATLKRDYRTNDYKTVDSGYTRDGQWKLIRFDLPWGGNGQLTVWFM